MGFYTLRAPRSAKTSKIQKLVGGANFSNAQDKGWFKFKIKPGVVIFVDKSVGINVEINVAILTFTDEFSDAFSDVVSDGFSDAVKNSPAETSSPLFHFRLSILGRGLSR